MKKTDRGDIRKFPKTRSNAARKGGAAAVKRKLDWLRQPLVYWSGARPNIRFQKNAAFRPILEIVAERLSGHSPGVYSVRIEILEGQPAADTPIEDVRKRVNPVVAEIAEVTESSIAAAARALKAVDKYPKAIKKIVAGVDAWRSHAETWLIAARAALAAARRLKDKVPESMAVEEICIWLGPDEARPSRTVETGALRSWLGKSESADLAGRRLASIVLGQRRVLCRLPGGLEAWRACGALLSSWPPDLVSRISDPPPVPTLRGLDKKALRLLDAKAGAVSFAECLWDRSGPGPDPLIPALAALLETGEAAFEEFPRRLAAMVGLIREANRREKTRQQSWDFESYRTRTAHLSVAFYDVFGSLAGEGLPASLTELLYPDEQDSDDASTGETADPLRRVSSLPNPLTAKDREAWGATVGGLAARAFARSGSLEAVAGLDSWLDACRRRCPPGTKGGDALDLAVRSWEFWMAQAAGNPSDLAALGRLLAGRGPALLEGHVKWETDAAGPASGSEPAARIGYFTSESWDTALAWTYWALGRMGTLSAEEADAVLEEGRLADIKEILLSRPASLKEYVGFIREIDRARAGAGGKSGRSWRFADKFRTVFEAGRGGALLRLAGRLTSRPGVKAPDPAVVDDLFEAMVDVAKDPRVSDDFLGRSRGMWDSVREALEARHRAFAEELSKDAWFLDDPRQDYVGAVLLANEWERQGFPDPGKAFRGLLERFAERDREAAGAGRSGLDPSIQSLADEYVSGVVRLSGGRVDRLLRLLDHKLPRGDWDSPEDPNRGWAFVQRFEGVRQFLHSCLDRKEWVGSVIGYLQRLVLALRFQAGESLARSFERWQDPDTDEAPSMPAGVLPELRRGVTEIAAYRRISGEAPDIPISIDRILGRAASVRAEIEKLEEMRRAGRLTGSAAKRLEKLAGYDREPGRLASWINADLRRAVEDQLGTAKFAALEAVVTRSIREFWDRLLPGVPVKAADDDWDNALRLYLDATKNRGLLKKLMRSEAKGDKSWIGRLSPNRVFRARMAAAGVEVAAWLGEFERQRAVGGDTWTLYAETDPLRVLQMGNLFGTCLGTGGVNSFSTIANAVEENKRVLFIRDGRGTIIGRKLIGLAATGEGGAARAALVGFRSYGATDESEKRPGGRFRSPWIKILFDESCLEIAARTGAGLESDLERLYELTEKIPLFAAWYNDGPETFDWWVIEAWSGHMVLGPDYRETLAIRVLAMIDDSDHRDATLRALLWLGEDALQVMRDAGERAFESGDLSFIRRFSKSGAVRHLAAEWLTQREGEGSGR